MTLDVMVNLSKIIYPDNTAVTYAYDANHNLVCVTDWANRVTTYTYDVNNRVVGVTKPDGSVTTTVYDNKQRVTSTVEKTATGVVITGFEYTYDDLLRIIEEKAFANSTKMCYTYDNLSRVTARTVKKLSDNSVVSTETFNYDAAGNVTSAPDSSFQYDTNNRLISFNDNPVSFVDPFGLSVWSRLKEKGRQVKDAWNTYVAEPVKEYVIEPIKENIIEPVSTFVEENVIEPVSNFVEEKIVQPATKFIDEKIIEPVLNWTIENAPDPIANFARDIKNYDKNNSSQQTVLESHYFSSYKGKLY